MTGKSFGYVAPQGAKDEKSYELAPSEWVHLLEIIWFAVSQGANPSLYTSKDGNALCVSLKLGNQQAKYWLGPGESGSELLARLVSEWNIPRDFQSPIDELINAELERERAYIQSKGGDG